MAGLTYDQYVTQVAKLAVVAVDNVDFQVLLPMMINYAELRIYRDLNLMSASEALFGPAYMLTAGNRVLSFAQNLPPSPNYPTGSSFLVSEQINLISPSGATDPDQATRIPLTPTTKEFLDAVYGSTAAPSRGQPQYYCAFNETIFFVGPVPDVDYFVEIVGTLRPGPLAADNTTTFLSQYLPDLLVMASMIYISAFQRNFGAESGDPAMAQSYENQYQTLLKSAASEEARKTYESAAWSSLAPATDATPSR
jgi:hypothetical protein